MEQQRNDERGIMATNPENPRPIGDRRGMAARIKRILLQPKAEWPVIDTEATTTGALLKGWVAPLAAIGPVAGLIGALPFGYGPTGLHYPPTMGSAITTPTQIKKTTYRD